MISPAELIQMDWHYPWLGLLALQPVAVALLLKFRRTRILHYADIHLLPWATRGSFGVRQDKWGKIIHAMVWLLLACAAAGPRLPLVSEGVKQGAGTLRHEMDIMVVLDVSPSMLAQDISPERLRRAKLKLQDLIPRLHGERIGLIAFSGSAGLLMPLSRDYDAFRYYLQLAGPDLFEAPGSAVASSLDLARETLMQSKSSSGAILLLTDGDVSMLSGGPGAAAIEAANALKSAGSPLYILGLSTEAGAPIPMRDGGFVERDGVPVVSRPDQSGFRELARLGDGKFTLVEDGDGDWRTLYDKGLLALPGGKQFADSALAWRELYAWFLFPALLLSLAQYVSIRQIRHNVGGITFLLSLGIALSGVDAPRAYAADTSWQEAYSAYRKHEYSQAQALYIQLDGYQARMGEGAAAYRRKDYLYAVKQFSAALLEAQDVRQRETALFNLGNSYFLAGSYRASADAYLGVLRYSPDSREATANLALAAGKLAEQVKLDRYSAGILGRRGRQTGGDLGEEIDGRSVSLDSSPPKKGASAQLSEGQMSGEQAKLRDAKSRTASDKAFQQPHPDRLYRSALKKLELVEDKSAVVQKELGKLQARETQEAGGMSPW